MTTPGSRLSFDGALCTVRYVGPVAGTSGSWLGVEWDDPTRGKHDGRYGEKRYFQCRHHSPTAASFVRPSRPAAPPRDFLSALHEKYASDTAEAASVVISGKVAEEVGFDKIRRKQARLGELKVVILDGLRIAAAYLPGASQRIRDVCPRVVELDLSRSLFSRFGVVVDICAELADLRSLRLNGLRLDDVSDVSTQTAFRHVRDLELDETLLDWDDVCRIASRFPALASLSAGTNQLSSLIPFPPLASSLTLLNLEFNDFGALSDLSALVSVASLRTLHLKGNRIAAVARPGCQAPVFHANLRYLDVSYNQIASWSFVDALPDHLPGLVSLRLAHNPIYEGQSASSAPASSASASSAPSTEESYMLTLARLPRLQTLNFSSVSAADRANADMFYLSRIARQLAAVPEASEAAVLAGHPRWAELCALYGEPAVVRRLDVHPNFLEARLVAVDFCLDPAVKSAQIPKSMDMYAVKGIAGRLFGLSPLRLRLVWETGEWDPVAGFDEGSESEEDASPQTGRWVKREVELKDGPRQLGYCVDGLEARIRVEVGGKKEKRWMEGRKG